MFLMHLYSYILSFLFLSPSTCLSLSVSLSHNTKLTMEWERLTQEFCRSFIHLECIWDPKSESFLNSSDL
jgi:hypothetical protein